MRAYGRERIEVGVGLRREGRHPQFPLPIPSLALGPQASPPPTLDLSLLIYQSGYDFLLHLSAGESAGKSFSVELIEQKFTETPGKQGLVP